MNKLINLMFIILFFINTIPLNSCSEEVLIINESEKINDISVKVKLLSIRSLDEIDEFSDPDFQIKVYINNIEFTSGIWHNTRYIYNPDFSPTVDIPSDEDFIDIKIQLWDYADEHNADRLCDISGDFSDSDDSYDVELIYNTKTGHWTGDDFRNSDLEGYDPSGYGRLNGCDDGTIYTIDRDCELWFDIYQNDIDGDKIPDWMETNVYGTDPEVDNSGEDIDEDGVPIEWEHRWGYDPLTADNHAILDPENDGINNVEEYLTSQ
ncbi:MAG: hypothetical protein KAJ21_06220, partial [Thermoplasmatales archaeon]|nr:hypothetical protein [Thermoplasmatales archaeon]